mgnify:CR=1 FL=1
MFVTDYTMHLLDNVKKIHFIGCGGSGMYPLIQILTAKGYDISGSDVLDGSIIRSEREMGVKVSLGHAADNVIGSDLVVYSAAIAKDNVELNAAASYGIPTVERSVLLGYVSRLYKDSICVSGTHGKTTTTSMITTALELAGRDPSAVIGGKLPLIGGYGKAGKGDDIVIEACEFSETFLKLTPYMSVVLNIDNDHLDYYGSMGELKFAFKRFALMTHFMIFANADDKNTMDVMYTLDRRVRTFAIDNAADYRAVNVQEYKPGFFEFDLKEWDTNASRGGACLMARAVAILHTYGDFDAIGISTAGQVDSEQGSIYYANDNIPGYTGTKIRDILEAEFGVPVAVENDVNAAALGELYFGAAKGAENFLCLTYGTGVGGAIVIDGSIYPGSTWSGGSFGGILTHPEAMEPSSCR